MALSERIRILMVKRGNISEAELARRMGESPQNLNNKMKRDNFSERDMYRLADALDCDVEIVFKSRDTGEVI